MSQYLTVPDEPVFLKYKGKTYNGKIVIVEKNGSKQIGIIDSKDGVTNTPSKFCSKHIGYECNGWVKLYVIRDGKKMKLSELREAPPTRKRAKSHTPEKNNTNGKTKKKREKTPPSSPASLVSMTPPPPPSRSVSPHSSHSSLVSMTPPPPPSRSVSPPSKKSPSPLLINVSSPKKPSPKKPSPKKPSPKKSSPKKSSPKKYKSTSSIDGASIILWYKNNGTPMILVGTESTYVSDIYPEVEKHQTTSESDLEKAKYYFFKKTKELEEMYNITRVQYDDPKKIGDSYHINYRYLTDNPKRGIVKGRMEENEDVKKTIIREVAEEVGVTINKKPQDKIVEHGICDKYFVFSIELDEEDIPFFEKRIKERIVKKRGEMFDLRFEPLCSVLSSFNYRSKCAIEKFKDYYNMCK